MHNSTVKAGVEKLLSLDEPAAFHVSGGGNRAWLLICDHASNRIPARLGDMGTSSEDRVDHIAWDIGALDVANRLAERLDAPLVACGYSRLVIDCNRYPTAPNAMPTVSDGRVIPGNAGLSDADRAARVAAIFTPYHRAIAGMIDQALAEGVVPAIVSIHTCTPAMAGVHRPWEIGLGWSRDRRMVDPVLAALRAVAGLSVGDNQPYDLEPGYDFTTPEHAMARGLAHLQVEFRNDCVATAASAARYADIFFDALTSVADTRDWHVVRHYLGAADGIAGFGVSR